MSTAFSDMQAALELHLQDFASSEGVEVAWEMARFTPANETYFRPTFLPGSTRQASLGDSGMDATTGVFQVDVFTPKGSPRSTYPDDIADHFRRGLSLVEDDATVRIRTTSISATTHGDAYSITPVSISWDAYTEAR